MNGPAGVVTSPEVADALAEGRPVVGLETAVLTHGLPREPRERPTSLGPDHEAGRLLEGRDWDAGAPFNLESVRAIADAARHAGAVPATIGVIDGVLRIGLDDAELERLALDEAARKASTRSPGLRSNPHGREEEEEEEFRPRFVHYSSQVCW